MSGRERRPEPAAANRFRKGISGNPKGRPKGTPTAAARSPFDVIIKRTLTISRSGKAREVTVEEALQHRTLEDALAGNRTARREILRMIAEREQWRAAARERERDRQQESKPREQKVEHDPRNADEAMLLLGIAIPDPEWEGDNRGYERLKLAPWAVQAAFGRRGRAPPSDKELKEIERCTAKDAAHPEHPAEP